MIPGACGVRGAPGRNHFPVVFNPATIPRITEPHVAAVVEPSHRFLPPPLLLRLFTPGNFPMGEYYCIRSGLSSHIALEGSRSFAVCLSSEWMVATSGLALAVHESIRGNLHGFVRLKRPGTISSLGKEQRAGCRTNSRVKSPVWGDSRVPGVPEGRLQKDGFNG